MKMRILWLLVLCVTLVGGPASTASQTAATRSLMRDKLELSHHVLDAVMTSNLDVLERDSVALARVTERPGWMVLATPEYVRYSGAFVAAAQELAQAAKDHDLDAASVRYASMTMACYQCHRYVKSTRVARK
jgi:hypothetical protein